MRITKFDIRTLEPGDVILVDTYDFEDSNPQHVIYLSNDDNIMKFYNIENEGHFDESIIVVNNRFNLHGTWTLAYKGNT